MLGWSINLFRIFGIQLAVHVSFLLLLAYYGYLGFEEGGWLGAGWSMTLIVLFFACVVLHELGHSLTAMRYGVRVPRILLMPIGGMAEFDRIPRKPSAELLITAAGPAVNFVLVAILLPLVWTDLWSEQAVPRYGIETTLIELTFGNLLMGTFNLLPIFPMDGGRILRAALARKMDYLKATRRALLVARIVAPVLALGAVYFLQWYLLAALFIFIFFAGDAEYRHLVRREQEAAYWAEWNARVLAERARAADSSGDEPPPPPVIYHGPN
jgi:Zn-dependent protease